MYQSQEIDEVVRWAFFIQEKIIDDKKTIFIFELDGLKYELECEKKPWGYMDASGFCIAGYRNGKPIKQTNMVNKFRKFRV